MQTSFTIVEKFEKDAHVVKAEAALLSVLRLVVSHISIKELAFKLDISPSLLADALAERSNKGVRASWLVTIINMATDADAATILDCLGALKNRKSELIETFTPEQLNERYEEKLRSLGPVGMQLIREAQGASR